MRRGGAPGSPWAIRGFLTLSLAAVAQSHRCVSLGGLAAALSGPRKWRRRSVGARAFHGRLEPVHLGRERKHIREVELPLLTLDFGDHAGVGSGYVA